MECICWELFYAQPGGYHICQADSMGVKSDKTWMSASIGEYIAQKVKTARTGDDFFIPGENESQKAKVNKIGF